MDVALWVGQALLAAVFLASGVAKSTQSRARMIETGQSAAKIVPLPLMRVAGGTELAAAAGLLLPWATGIAPVLTPLAAVGLAVVMVLAAGVHTRLREPGPVAANAVLLAGCVAVAWGRFAGL